jgi:16S rRNA (guanine966-N2)-methyltransferase
MSRVLDLYAGSGALGIEAISRGGRWCDFVEQDRAACEAIRQNLRLTGFENQASVYQLSADIALSHLTGPYTLVLADPPYEDNKALILLKSLMRSPLAKQGRTVLVLEHSFRREPPNDLGGLGLVNSRRHGDSAISIYR